MSKNLFDEENEIFNECAEESETVSEELTVHLDNNDGTEFQQFGKFAVDENWLYSNRNETRNPYDEFESSVLEENLYEIFLASPFVDKYEGNKKVPKHEMLNVYLYFLDRIKETSRFTAVEKFISISLFMKMNFEAMYRELSIVHKEEILKELNRKYFTLSNKRAHKLF